MSETLPPNEIVKSIGCELRFIEDFKAELKLALEAAVGNEGQDILSEIARMAKENKGIAELPITIKVVCRLKHSQFKVTGTIAYERKYRNKNKLEELSVDFRQPDLPFGKAPEPGQEGEYEKENPKATDEDIYNLAIDLIAGQDEPKISTAKLKDGLKISFERAARIITMLEKDGTIGPEENGSHEVIADLLRPKKQKEEV